MAVLQSACMFGHKFNDAWLIVTYILQTRVSDMRDRLKGFLDNIEAAYIATFNDNYGHSLRDKDRERQLSRQKRSLTEDFCKQKCTGYPAGETIKAVCNYMAETILHSYGLGSKDESLRLTIQNAARAVVKAAQQEQGQDEMSLELLIELLEAKQPEFMSEAEQQMQKARTQLRHEESQRNSTDLMQAFSKQAAGRGSSGNSSYNKPQTGSTRTCHAWDGRVCHFPGDCRYKSAHYGPSTLSAEWRRRLGQPGQPQNMQHDALAQYQV